MTVTPAPLTITANNESMVYGTVVPALTVTYSGLVNGDTSDNLSILPVQTTTAMNSSSVAGGPYAITSSGAVDPDYSITYAAGSLTVTAAPLTIIAVNQSMSYGGTLPTLSVSYSGFVNGDTSASLTAQPTLTTTATASSPVGGYSITASGASDSNYAISYASGTLSINRVDLAITAVNQTMVYGSSLPTLTASYKGFVNGDTLASLTTLPTLTTTATASSHVSGNPYTITASGAVDPNYSISYTTGTLTITTATLTITTTDQTKVYGESLPTLTATYSGFVNGDTTENLTSLPALSTTATSFSHVASSPYPIFASGASDDDYTIVYVFGSLTVTMVPLTITADDQSKAYAAALPTLTVSYTGLVAGDTAGTFSNSPNSPPTITTTATSGSHVAGGPYTITAIGAVDSDYTITYVSGGLTITQVPLTITANDKTKVYGAAPPNFTASYSGFVNGDTSSSLTTPPTFTTTATAASHVSGNPYAITPSGAVDPDYTVSYSSGRLTVTQAPLTITAEDQSMVYGSDLPTLTASYTGLANGDTSDSLTVQPTLSTTATSSSHVGGNPYPIAVSGAADGDYSISYVSGSLTVTPAPLTITADDQTIAYGAGLPTLTASYSGLVNGDTPDDLTLKPTLTTTAATGSHVAGSPYPITAGAAVDSDYAITYVAGGLTVMPVALTITADDAWMIVGGPVPSLSATYSGFVNGDTSDSLTTPPTLSTNATSESLPAGNPYTVTAAGAVDSDYTISYMPGTLNVIDDPGTSLGITVEPGSTSLYGQAITFTVVVTPDEGGPTPTGTIDFVVNGTELGSPVTMVNGSAASEPISSLHVGDHPVDVTYSGDDNYGVNGAQLTQTITPAPLTITPGDQAKDYGDANPTLTLTYGGLVNDDTSSSLTTPPDVSTITTSYSQIGAYPIIASGAYDPDYTISYGTGTMTVDPAPLRITADDLTKVYGAAMPTLTASYSGFVNGDSVANFTTAPTLSTTATTSSHVSGDPYDISASGAVDPDYAITYVDGNLTITPALLTITANSKTMVYGGAFPTLTASYSGFVNGDTAASLTTPPTLTSTATASSHVSGSPYNINAGGAVNSDYTIRYVAGTLTITPAALTITADDQTKVYGAALPTLTATYTGLTNGDTPASLTTAPTLATTATAASPVATLPYVITVGGAVDTDYSIGYASGSLTVTPAALTITADDQTKVYGAVLPTLTASYSGLVNGDTPGSLAIQPALTTTATNGSRVAGGPYSITAMGAVDTNYTIAYVTGLLTVTPAPLTITPDNKSKNYGADLPTLTVSYTGFVNGDTLTDLTTQPTLTTTATAASHVAGSPYPITAAGAVNSDYAFSYVAGTLTVKPVGLTITASSLSSTYGATLPALTASYSGFVNDDTSADLATQPSLTTTATSSSHVSGNPYTVTVSGASDSDYSISYAAGTMTITPAPLTVICGNQSKVYGATVPALTISYSGFVNGDTSADLTTQPTVVTNVTSHSHVSGNPYVIIASGAAEPDYAIVYQNGTMTVTTAPLTITASSLSKNYAAALPTLTATYSGFVNSDTTANLTTQAILSTTATASSHVSGSPYPITASGATDSDYTITFVPGTLTVNPVALTITAVNKSKVYGAALPALTASYTGFVNGDTSSSLTTQPTLNTTATGSSHVSGSPYTITASGAVDTDYTIGYVNGTLTVTKAPLTVTANNQTKVYGAALPSLTVSFTGFVNGDTSASLATQPSLSTTATAASHVVGSPYNITASGAVDTDYSFTYVTGHMTVTQAPLTITANNQTKVYGAALPALTATYTGFVNGDTSTSLTTQPTLASTATASSHVSGNPYSITASGAVDADYSITYVPGTLTVTTASLTITANNQTKVYGAALPTLTASYSGFVNGDSSASLATQPSLSTTATAASHRQRQPLRHHRQRRRRRRLHDRLHGRDADRHGGPADDHGE